MAKHSLERLRRRRQALELAGAEAAAGRMDGIGGVLAAAGLANAYTDSIDLAVSAQRSWWTRVLGRLQAALEEDGAGDCPQDRMAAARQAWSATAAELPGHLLLADHHRDHPAVVRDARRYGRLLALFTSLATVDDNHAAAADAGLAMADAFRAEVARAALVGTARTSRSAAPRPGPPRRQCMVARLVGACRASELIPTSMR